MFAFILYIICFLFQNSVISSPPPSFHKDKISTQLSSIELAELLNHTHYVVFHEYPSASRLAMAWAQIALENHRGNKIFNFNLGNIGAAKNQLYYTVAGFRFRSFSSFNEGATFYWNHLNNKCHNALSSFNWGDTNLAAKYLKGCNYYKTDLLSYQYEMNNLYYVALKSVIPKMKDR